MNHSDHDFNLEFQELKAYKQAVGEPEERWPRKIKVIYLFIIQNIFNWNLNVTWIKENCGLNGKSYSGHFKYYTGYTIKEFIIYHRLSAAKQLLKETKHTATVIGYAVGYQKFTSFCKIFKIKEGLTPKEWRKKG